MMQDYSLRSIFYMLFIALFSTVFSYGQSFSSTGLIGENLTNPTSLDFGPNGKLYVAQQNGDILEYTIIRDDAAPGQGSYGISNTQIISLVRTGVPNHNDDSSINTMNTRQVTGILATGTATSPILYVSSSDTRHGGAGGGTDTNLDTNSGILSRLTWTGSEWDKVDLVRGLPRCEENHSTNGMDIFERDGNTYLLLQQGGNANKGAPSNNFAGSSETFLTAALLIVNLTQLEAMEAANGGPYIDTRQGTTQFIYDLPTLNDPKRSDITNASPNFPYTANHPLYNATIDVGDPFGGNNGLNQAFAEPGGPVQIFSPGYRNAYDVVITADGRIFAGDNGPNTYWGGTPVIYESKGALKLNSANEPSTVFDASAGDYITNDFNESNSEGHGDALHYVGTINDVNGTYYAGHPVATRAFPSRAGIKVHQNVAGSWTLTADYDFTDLLVGVSGYFNSDFQISDFPDDPRQGEYLAGQQNHPNMNILDLVNLSTNGICEYTASNFGGAMQGDILTASYSSKGLINRYQLDGTGTGLLAKDNSFLSGFDAQPLDVIAQGDDDIFPGTIWAATYGANNITVFEPSDFAGCLEPGDPGYVGSEDYDSDGYTNDDELANGTDICSGGSKPADHDGDFISDLSDLDDDNDGIADVLDAFALDADNGTGTNLPISYPFWNNDPGTGLYGLGFTGLMLNPNGTTDYLEQIDEDILAFGGAGGKATIEAVSEGDARGTSNSQENAFHVGINVDANSAPFTAHTRIEGPFAGVIPESGLSYGMYIGNGDQDHYVKVALMEGENDTDETYGFEVVVEDGPENISVQKFDVPGVFEGASVDLYISVDPSINLAQAYYSIDGGDRIIALGAPVQLPNAVLETNDNRGTAVGLIATSVGPGPEYTATWDFLNIAQDGEANLAISENPVNVGILAADADRTQFIPSLFNEGGPQQGSIEIGEITFAGPGASLFENLSELPLIVGPGAEKTLPLNFYPDGSAGTKTADLVITHSGANSPLVVPLQAVLTNEVEPTYTVVARVNAGGETVSATDGKLNWETNAVAGATNGTNYSVNTGQIPGGTNPFTYADRHSSVPDYIDEATFYALYGKERFDIPNGPEMEFQFPVDNGDYVVNIYTGNGYGPANAVGARLFDISLENEIKGNDIDVVALFGGTGDQYHAGMLSYETRVEDGILNVLFEHGAVENPVVQAIEILHVDPDPTLITLEAIPDQRYQVGDNSVLAISATGGDSQENFTYTISGQPAGIDIEPTNGQIFGVIEQDALNGGPNGNGVHQVTVTVSKPGSQPKSTVFIWSVVNLIWTDKDENENYTARHECSLVQAGDKFYLMGGRENTKTIDVYDYTSNSWAQLPDSPPADFNHFQAIEYHGLIWVIGAFTDNVFPNEQPAEYVWAFDPANNAWIQGPEIPAARRRGSTGLVVYKDKFYISGGNQVGHNGQWVPWFDEYDPATGTWTPLADAPRPRDHFHAEVIGDKMYLAGGRLSGGDGGTFAPTISEVDVYDFTSGSWSTLPTSQNLPTPRAAAAVANLNGKLLVIGGEVEDQMVDGTLTSDALVITEQYDPATQSWSRLPDLNYKRHGTQAILSGEGVFVLGGSPKLGGGNQKNMEYLGEDAPSGSPLVASILQAPEVVDVEVGTAVDFKLRVADGNTGIPIRSMTLTGPDASNYTLVSGNLDNGFLVPDSEHSLRVALSETAENTSALLTVEYGAASSLQIVLKNGELTSGFVNPGTQYNKENDTVSLSILTDNSGSFTYTASSLPPGLTIDETTGLLIGKVNPGVNTGPFLEDNGLVVIEAESGAYAPEWSETTLNGAIGILANTNSLNGQNGGTISYEINITDPGVYRFNWRSFYSGESATDENDNWLRFPNNDDVWFFGYKGNPGTEVDIIANLNADQESIVFPKGSSRSTSDNEPEGSSGNGYFKIYRSGGLPETYDWQARTSDNDAHNIYIWFVNPGTYSFEVSERSAGHAIDKMALYKVDGPSFSNNALTSAGESDRGPGDANDGGQGGSPYRVTITVTDAGNLADTTTEEFTWIVDNSGDPKALPSANILQGEVPLEVAFTGSTSADDTAISTYLWEYGDAANSTSTESDPSFTFTEAGSYSVSLTVTDTDGNTNTESLSITADAKPVHPIFASAGPNGAISPEGRSEVEEGASRSFSITPEAGFRISEILVDGVAQAIMEEYTFENVLEAHSISVSFEAIVHAIVATSTTGGSIDPAGTTLIVEGNNMSYSIVAENGYRVAEVTVDGVSQGAISFYQFIQVNKVHTIAATFEKTPDYNILASAGLGGTISPTGTVKVLEGEHQTFIATANAGYSFEHFLVDGAITGDMSEYTFESVVAQHTIEAVFTATSKIATYTIRAGANTGGTLSPSGSVEIFEGQSQSFTITPDEGFEIKDIIVNGDSLSIVENYTFENVQQDHTLEVVFGEIIDNVPPVARAASDIYQSFAPLTVNFNANDSSDDQAIVSYVWDFGDGNTTDGDKAVHIYTEPGVYTARLTVTDEQGATDTDDIQITVKEPPIVNPSGEDALRVFPNPASSQVSLRTTADTELVQVYIYNSDGRLMRSYDAKQLKIGRRYVINVLPFVEGIYFILSEDVHGEELRTKMYVKR